MSEQPEEIEVFQLLLPLNVTLWGNLAIAIDAAAAEMGYAAVLRVDDDPQRPVIVLRGSRAAEE